VHSKTNDTDIKIDEIIEKLISVKNQKTTTFVTLTNNEISTMITKCKDIFMKQPILLELEAPIAVLGDIHGQYTDLLKLFEIGGFPPKENYLFLGDYVDRGKQSIETICLLMAYKIKFPENFFLLRGNHESEYVNRLYGFYDECKRRYNLKIWKMFTDMFNFMPVAALIDDKIFCVHGGLSPDMNSIDDILKINRPTEVPNGGLLCDILWSDPSLECNGWEDNDRGVSYVFSQDITKKFLEKNNIDLICRAHQVVEDGYEFFADKQLITIFSAPDYCGEYGNSAALMTVDENLMCSFKFIKSTNPSV